MSVTVRVPSALRALAGGRAELDAGEDVRFRDLLDTPVREGDRVTIVPAIAGGA